MSRHVTLSKPKVVPAGKVRAPGTWEPADDAHSRGNASDSRFFAASQYVDPRGSKAPQPAASPPHNRAPVGEPYSQAPVPLIHQALFPEVKPPPPQPSFITAQKVDPDISKHFRASASAQMLDSLIYNIREEKKTKKSKRVDADEPAAVIPSTPQCSTCQLSRMCSTHCASLVFLAFLDAGTKSSKAVPSAPLPPVSPMSPHASKGSQKHLAASLSSPLAQSLTSGSGGHGGAFSLCV